MSERPRCYVASALGFTEAGRGYYADVLLPRLREVVDPFDPWSLVTEAQVAAAVRDGTERALWTGVGRQNADAIAESEVLVAILDGQEIDSGTAAEVGYACGLGRPCIGLRSDLREIGEPGMALNLQLECFVLLSGGRMVTSLDELVEVLAERDWASPAAP